MPELGVNIDHVATIREARKTYEPDPVWAAVQAELGGADGITIHLREDRRHIRDRDLRILRQTVQVKLNLEMAATQEMTAIAVEARPEQCSLVPEKREEVTTEGGLDVISNREKIRDCAAQLNRAGIKVSLFIDPDPLQVEASRELDVDAVELHTGRYADAQTPDERNSEFDALEEAGRLALDLNLKLHMGHGLNYRNVSRIAAIPGLGELNIGHSIIARSIFVGLEEAVREMKALVAD